MIFSQGAFQIDPNATPEEVAKKRALVASLMPRFGSAKYVGEGIGQLATGVAMGRLNKSMDTAEGNGRSGAGDLFSRVMGRLSESSPTPAGPVDPMSPKGIANDTMAAIGKPQQGGDREAFIQQMMPHAMRVAEKTGLDPRLVIAQAAQETGWGKSAPGNNYFGIKSHGKPGGNTLATNEVIDGQTVRMNDSFRGYGGMGESADGYAEFLQQNPRYKQMLSAPDLEGQIAALGQSGYATDPNYARSVGSIANSIPGVGGQTAVTSAQNAPMQQGPQVGGQIPMQDLYEAMSNPWMNPQQKAVIGSMIEQRQQQSDPMRQLQMQKMQAEIGKLNGASGGTEYGLNPQYGVDGNGNPVLIQIGKDGTSTQTPLPEGVTLSKEPIKLDAGTHYVLLDPITRQPIGQIAKDNRGAASETAIGKIEGTNKAEAAAGLSSAADQAMQAGALIDSIVSDPALPGITGMVQGNLPPMNQAGVDLDQKIKQLKGKAFLEAFESLKGGGAITEREGAAATAAMARLDRAQSTSAYVAALTELKEIMAIGVERAREKAGGMTPVPPAVAAPPANGWQDMGNGVKIRVKE